MGIDPAQTLAELIALSVSTSASAYVPKPSGPLPRLQDAQQLSEVAAKIQAAEPLSVLEAKIMAGGGSPGGGQAQSADHSSPSHGHRASRLVARAHCAGVLAQNAFDWFMQAMAMNMPKAVLWQKIRSLRQVLP